MAFNFRPSAAPTTSGFGAAAPATGGFGTTAPAAGGFGSAAPVMGGLGTTAPATGGFGAAPATGGFGSAAPATAGFGAAAPAAASGFGAAAPAMGGFGSAAPAMGGLGTTAPATGGFGMAAPATGGFGAAAPAAGGFGAAAKPSGFSFGTSTSQPASMFGTATAPATTSLFGKPAASHNISLPHFQDSQSRDKMIYNLLVQRHEQDRQQGLSRTDLRAENVWQSLALMTSWWDPQSPNCKFKTYFYNKVPPQEVPLYQRPADQDAKAWQEAQKKNPDPTCLVPTLAVGFTDLQKRMDAQNVQSQAYDNKLQEIRTKLEKMQQHSTVDSADKFKRATEKQRVLVQRVIQVLKYTQVLQQRGLSITQEEEDMRSAYEGLYEELARSEQFGGTLGEKWSQLQLIKESGRVGTSELERELINTDRQAEVAKMLDEKQRGIQQIMQVLQQDAKDIKELSSRLR